MRPMSSLTGKIGCSVKTMENRSPVCPVLTFTAGIIILFLVLSSALLFAQEIWVPPQRTSWQWQLNGRVNQSYDVDMYDIDLFETDPSVVLSLHCLLYTSPSPRDRTRSRMPSSA